MNRARHARIALLVAVTWGVVAPAPAGAEAGSDQHCVGTVDTFQTPDGVVHQEPAAARLDCFETFAAAISYATDGRVVFPRDASTEQIRRDLGDRLAAEANADTAYPEGYTSGDTIVGIDYDLDWIDEQLIWKTSHTAGCTDGTSFEKSSMPSGWNDKVDHAEAYQGCDQYVHYEHENYGGAQLTCTCATMGVMEDATSSEKWSRTPPPKAAAHVVIPPVSDDDPAGQGCGLVATTDPAPDADSDSFVGTLSGGPLAGDGTLSCTIQVNVNEHGGADTWSESAPSSDGAAVMEPRSVNYVASDDDQVYLCTSWQSGPTTHYWTESVFGDPSSGHWTTDPNSPCNVPTQMSTGPVFNAVDDVLGGL